MKCLLCRFRAAFKAAAVVLREEALTGPLISTQNGLIKTFVPRLEDLTRIAIRGYLGG